jgi:hypothetical protein
MTIKENNILELENSIKNSIENYNILEKSQNLKTENDKNGVEESENLKLMIEDLNSQLQLSTEEVHSYVYIYAFIYTYVYAYLYNIYIYVYICTYLYEIDDQRSE